MSTIVEQIGVPALLEQTAEECCELAQACLKMARKLRDENPTPKSVEDIREELVEEMADVHVCLSHITFTTDLTNPTEIGKLEHEKSKRWFKRLGLYLDLDEPGPELDDVVYSD